MVDFVVLIAFLLGMYCFGGVRKTCFESAKAIVADDYAEAYQKLQSSQKNVWNIKTYKTTILMVFDLLNLRFLTNDPRLTIPIRMTWYTPHIPLTKKSNNE